MKKQDGDPKNNIKLEDVLALIKRQSELIREQNRMIAEQAGQKEPATDT